MRALFADFLKVFRGALVVIKGKLINSLYHLQGSTILGSANVSSTVDSDAASTQLWHMCLGHMSERGLTELSKRGCVVRRQVNWISFSIVFMANSAG